eukprot:1690332-Ditylum_brightwellii.AAC.1
MSGQGHKVSTAHSLLVESANLINLEKAVCIVPMGQSLSSLSCSVDNLMLGDATIEELPPGNR